MVPFPDWSKNKGMIQNNKHGPGPFGTEMDHSGPRRGLRPSLRWGQIGLHFGLQMLILPRFFHISVIFGVQKGPRPGGQPRPQKFHVNINEIRVFIFSDWSKKCIISPHWSGGARQPARGLRISCARAGAPRGVLSSVCLSVCLSVCDHLRKVKEIDFF